MYSTFFQNKLSNSFFLFYCPSSSLQCPFLDCKPPPSLSDPPSFKLDYSLFADNRKRVLDVFRSMEVPQHSLLFQHGVRSATRMETGIYSPFHARSRNS